jgi:hypothetical protein
VIALNEIEVAMMTYISYVNRKIKEDPGYEPHPIVKAISLAIAASENQVDGRYSGVAGDPKKEGLHMVVIEKHGETSQILSLFDAKMGMELGFDVAVMVLKISMQLDRVVSDEIQISDLVEILSENFPSITFKHISPNEGNEAILFFKEQYRQGKVRDIPENMRPLIDQELNRNIRWEDRSPEFRTLVGGLWASKAEGGKSVFTITSPDTTVPKYKVLEIVKMLMVSPQWAKSS